jgi:hypothetical protein
MKQFHAKLVKREKKVQHLNIESMRTTKKNKKQDLIPDLHKIEEIRHVEKKLITSNRHDEKKITGPKSTRREEKDPGEYPMKNV